MLWEIILYHDAPYTVIEVPDLNIATEGTDTADALDMLLDAVKGLMHQYGIPEAFFTHIVKANSRYFLRMPLAAAKAFQLKRAATK